MKVRITRSCVAEGKDLSKGKVYDLPDKVAKFLIALNKAEEVKGAKSK